MFQTCHPYAKQHAVSRAFSGGPIFISDVMDGNHDMSMVTPLLMDPNGEGDFRGRILKPWTPGTVSGRPSRIFADVRSGNGALVIRIPRGSESVRKGEDNGAWKVGTSGGCEVFGVFNVCENESRWVGDRVGFADLSGDAGVVSGAWVSFEHFGRAWKISDARAAGDGVALVLPPRGVEVVTFAPLFEAPRTVLGRRWSVGCVGCTEKYIGAAAMEGLEVVWKSPGEKEPENVEIVIMEVTVKVKEGVAGDVGIVFRGLAEGPSRQEEVVLQEWEGDEWENIFRQKAAMATFEQFVEVPTLAGTSILRLRLMTLESKG
ncbi:hypothetical protein HDU97_001148 [Phlyctochytrium planicorne]|nr:hypothetical protein HDU97_001148 [Phlyctochytrium planicorne]